MDVMCYNISLLVIPLVICLAYVHGITFELPDKVQSCFYELLTHRDQYTLEYTVIKGGALDVDVVVTAPNGKTVYNKKKQKEGIVLFQGSPGTFTFCFGNTFSTITHKVVFMTLISGTEATMKVRSQDEQITSNTRMESNLERIYQRCSRAIRYQVMYRNSEGRSRYQAEQLHDHIQWWSIGETLIIFISSVGQILVLRNFFTDKGYRR